MSTCRICRDIGRETSATWRCSDDELRMLCDWHAAVAWANDFTLHSLDDGRLMGEVESRSIRAALYSEQEPRQDAAN